MTALSSTSPETAAPRPLVSVAIITYNHSAFIEECLQSIFAQVTDFPFEVVVADDASTDDTPQRISQFAPDNPNAVLRPLLHTRNLGINPNLNHVIQACRGSYIAFIEGDDYWTDPQKLAIQTDFMRRSPQCAVSFHAAREVFQDSNRPGRCHRPSRPLRRGFYDVRDVVEEGGAFFMTATLMFRADAVQPLPDWFNSAPVGDFPLVFCAATHGRVGFIDREMSAYRNHSNGSWSSKARAFSPDAMRRYQQRMEAMLSAMNQWTSGAYAVEFDLRRRLDNEYFCQFHLRHCQTPRDCWQVFKEYAPALTPRHRRKAFRRTTAAIAKLLLRPHHPADSP